MSDPSLITIHTKADGYFDLIGGVYHGDSFFIGNANKMTLFLGNQLTCYRRLKFLGHGGIELMVDEDLSKQNVKDMIARGEIIIYGKNSYVVRKLYELAP